MSVLFYACVAAEIYLDIYFLRDIQVETGLYNEINKVTDDEKYFYIARSERVMIAHIICLGVTTILAILAPILQPLTRKIHVSRTPMRDVFKKLESDKLLVIYSQSGSYVTKIDLSGISDIMTLIRSPVISPELLLAMPETLE